MQIELDKSQFWEIIDILKCEIESALDDQADASYIYRTSSTLAALLCGGGFERLNPWDQKDAKQTGIDNGTHDNV